MEHWNIIYYNLRAARVSACSTTENLNGTLWNTNTGIHEPSAEIVRVSSAVDSHIH